MNAILCALDFSDASDNVMEVALEMAAQKQTNLVVLFAYRLLQPESQEITEYRKNMEKQAQSDFATLTKKLKINGDVPFEFRAEIGFISDRIEVYMKRNPVGLVVLGQNLANSINEHKGLPLENFLQTMKVPVLIVPEMYVPR